MLHQHARQALPARPTRPLRCLSTPRRTLLPPSRAVSEFQLGTVFSSGREANWLAPGNDSKLAKGVALFLHGFGQSPNAYYENLRGLADAGWLVVAPLPPFKATPGAQQAVMVEDASHFHSKLTSNSLTGLPLPSQPSAAAAAAAKNNIVLLGHSVGAGLATYVAWQAANEGQPFKAVMYMAPQTQVVKPYAPASAIQSWPPEFKLSTTFSVQYGLKDDLAPPQLSLDLIGDLRKGGLQIKDTAVYPFADGTHIGFEDQVVLGDAEVTTDILPWLNPLLLWLITSLSALGVPGLPTYLLGLLYKKKELAAVAPGGGGLLGAAPGGGTGGEEERQPLLLPTKRLLVNPLDIALLQQQAARGAAEQKPELLLGAPMKPPPADGLGPTETVKIASAEASAAQYVGLLVVAVAALVSLGSKTLEGFEQQGSVPWLYLLGTLLAGYFTYEGVYYLRLQNYVDTVQRPQSRANAKTFLDQWL